jgi:cell division protein FtsQ
MVAESAALGFRVREVFVIGRKRTPRDRLITALGIDRGSPILALDLHQARARILALPWVRDATVERLLPDTVVVRITEREAVALWQRRGLYSLIDERGDPFTSEDQAAFAHLLIVVGDDAPAHVPTLLRMLDAERDLKSRVKAAVRVGNRRWNLHFDGDVEVRLPADDAAGAWSRLATYQRTQRLLDKGLQTIDLRFADRLIVRRAAPGGTKLREGGSHA